MIFFGMGGSGIELGEIDFYRLCISQCFMEDTSKIG